MLRTFSSCHQMFRRSSIFRQILRVNVGGTMFQTQLSTLTKYPDTAFSKYFLDGVAQQEDTSKSEGQPAHVAAGPLVVETSPQLEKITDLFLDANPEVFARVLEFLRTGIMVLPTSDETLRSSLLFYLQRWQLMEFAFPLVPVAPLTESSSETKAAPMPLGYVALPDVCVVQMCDHMQHDQGVKRHAMTITFGADGFQLRDLSKKIRRDLNTQLSSTYWQCYQTNERAVFFVTTKVANGTADLLTTSITQQVVTHAEQMGYHLASSYVTLSPDVVHTSVRMFIHHFIFRRVRQAVPELSDELVQLGSTDLLMEDATGDGIPAEETYRNFEPRAVGPQKVAFEDVNTIVPPGERISKIWKD